jgi:hypothetical protein
MVVCTVQDMMECSLLVKICFITLCLELWRLEPSSLSSIVFFFGRP